MKRQNKQILSRLRRLHITKERSVVREGLNLTAAPLRKSRNAILQLAYYGTLDVRATNLETAGKQI